MRNVVGKPVRGNNFFDRQDELRRLWRDLEDNHVLILAPRRVGKTSVLFKLVAESRAKQCSAVFHSVARYGSELRLVLTLFKKVAEKDEGVWSALQKGRLERFLRGIQQAKAFSVELAMREMEEDDWRIVGDELVEAMQAGNTRWLLLLDELPVFVAELLGRDDGPVRAKRFLQWLREVRQGPPEGEDSLRWVLAGSIGLDALTQRLGLSATINDLLLYRLGPYDPANADAFLRQLGETHNVLLTDEIRSALLERIGWPIPHHLQVLFHQLRELELPATTPVTAEHVERVFEALTKPSSRTYFDTWYQRLTDELGRPQDGWARALLTACAKDPNGAGRDVLAQVLARQVMEPSRRDEELAWLITVLENDGYLVREGDRWRWRSPVLREYWLGRVS